MELFLFEAPRPGRAAAAFALAAALVTWGGHSWFVALAVGRV